VATPGSLLRRLSHAAACGLIVLAALAGSTAHTQAAAASAAAQTSGQTTIWDRIHPDDCHAPEPAALSELQSAIAQFQAAHDNRSEARAQALLGTLLLETGAYQAALAPLNSALALEKQIGGPPDQVPLMTLIGNALQHVGPPAPALSILSNAVDMAGKAGDTENEALALTFRAEAKFYNDAAGALQDLDAAQRHAHNPATRAIILNDQGAAAADPASADALLRQALSIEQQNHNCRLEAATDDNLGDWAVPQGQERNALALYQQALSTQKQTGDLSAQAMTLHSLGYFYQEMGDLDSALDYFQQAFGLEQKNGDLSAEGPTLGALAGVFRDRHQPDDARQVYAKAAPMLEQIQNVYWQAMVANNLGTVEADMHNASQARTFYYAALQLAEQIHNTTIPPYTEWGLGELEESDAVSSYFLALRGAKEDGDGNLAGMVDASLMDHFSAKGDPNLAIFFGKEAVDAFQAVRGNLAGMSNDVQSSFLQKKAGAYRKLAGLLIDQGRYVEAQQILDLLKIQQYADYINRPAGNTAGALVRTAAEAAAHRQYQARLTQWVAADAARQKAAAANKAPAPGSASNSAAGPPQPAPLPGLNTFLDPLDASLQTAPGAKVQQPPVSGMELPLENLLRADPHTAALYTLLGEDHYRVLVITAARRFPGASSVGGDALAAKCRNFLDLLRDQKIAPRWDLSVAAQPVGAAPAQSPTAKTLAAAEELFGILYAPVQQDLEKMGVTSLVWYLDGALRYIPIAALRDPRTGHYLVQDEAVVNFSPLGQALQDRAQLSGAAGIGMGISNSYQSDLPALPAAATELDSVFTDPKRHSSHGPLPGPILLNDDFTRSRMEGTVHAQAVVHIASHFVLTPGNDDLSWLLLGGDTTGGKAYHFSMAEFSQDSKVNIRGTRLFTLSACDTGAANERDDGVVMEGMSEAVLEKGAEAVISSLWSVTDASTGDLMSDFYRLWVTSHGQITKAQALRQAERDLIAGKAGPGELTATGASRFAAPYYWAPFLLTGNWQ
jgi:CHAT domain-containing protein/tetratricopeptide (TPR) repeat protein